MNIIIVAFSLLIAGYILFLIKKETVVHHVKIDNKENNSLESINVPICDCNYKSYANYIPYVGVHNYLKEGVELDTPFNTGALGVIGEKCMHEAMALTNCHNCAMKMCTIPGPISGKIS